MFTTVFGIDFFSMQNNAMYRGSLLYSSRIFYKQDTDTQNLILRMYAEFDMLRYIHNINQLSKNDKSFVKYSKKLKKSFANIYKVYLDFLNNQKEYSNCYTKF